MSIPVKSENNTPRNVLADPLDQQGHSHGRGHGHGHSRQDQDVLINSGSVAFLPVGASNGHQMTGALPDSMDKWAPPSFNAYNKPTKTIQKQVKKKPQRPIEIIVCKGTETVVPKSRSQGERRYVCNGHTIHRVTFWRHRKHGCPHGNGQSVHPKHSMQGKKADEGHPNGDVKQTMTSTTISQLPSVTGCREGDHMEGHHLMHDAMDFSSQMHSRGVPMEMSSSHMHGVKSVPVSMSFPMMDGSIDLSMQSQGKLMKNPNIVTGMPAMKSAFPGIDSMMSDAAMMSGTAQPTHLGHMPTGTLPPFSLMPDQLNFVYAPYQPADPDDDEINALTTPYVGPGSPYASDRSEASDFLDDGDLFNSYLERSGGI